MQQSEADHQRLEMAKRNLVPFEGDRIVLRLLENADLPLTMTWRNQIDIRKWFVHSDIIVAEKHNVWFKRYEELDNDFVFVILAKDLGNLPIGQISLYDIDWDAYTAEFGRLMIGDSSARRKGYASEATQLLLKYGFEQMKLKEVNLDVKEGNASAIAIYQSSGFVEKIRKDGFITMFITSARYNEFFREGP